ncbi:MAG TPA: response regulator [Thermodesulfobacteriota bacterium]|nr:response regulator [Thermodesulfobacteriota bacterium]
MGERRFCPSCGEQVDTYVVARNNRTESCCVFCGLTVGAEQPLGTGRAERVIVADDAELIRTIVTDALLAKRLALSVKAVDNGAAFLELAVRWLREGTPPSLVILDLEMPRIDGRQAAEALRAVERAFDVALPAPILFVSAHRADEALQAFVRAYPPAQYLNKGAAGPPEQLAARVETLVVQLLGPRG